MSRHPSATGRVMLCPICRPTRYAGVVDPGCPCCYGAGVLVLGRWLAEHEPAVIARAVEMYLHEFSSAWEAGRPGGWEAVRAATRALVDAGALADMPTVHGPPEPDPDHHDKARLGRAARRLARELGAKVPTEPGEPHVLRPEGDGLVRPTTRTVMPVDELTARRNRRTLG